MPCIAPFLRSRALVLHGLAAVTLSLGTGASVLAQGNPMIAVPAAQTGIASVYSADLEGRLTASGEAYDGQKLTAAHTALPIGTRLRVTDIATGTSVIVTVNDRWGGGPGRVVNLSRRAADDLGIGPNGQREVRLEVEALGDGRAQTALPPDAPVRMPLPIRIEETPADPSGRARKCRNEADILGLKDQWYDNHVTGCLGRKTPRPGS